VVLHKEGRGFYEDLPVHPELPDFFTQAGQLLTLCGRHARFTRGAIGACLLHLVAERRFGEIQLARHGPNGPTLVQD
jgi:hypothetical protein